MRFRRYGADAPPAFGPFGDLELMRRDMDRLFAALSGREEGRSGIGVFPALNVTQDRENYYVRAELPGMNAKDIDISAVHNKMTLSGTRNVEREGESTSYHRREREAGSFNRSLVLPSEIDPARVEASYRHGILTVRLPKSEADKPRQITVQTS